MGYLSSGVRASMVVLAVGRESGVRHRQHWVGPSDLSASHTQGRRHAASMRTRLRRLAADVAALRVANNSGPSGEPPARANPPPTCSDLTAPTLPPLQSGARGRARPDRP